MKLSLGVLALAANPAYSYLASLENPSAAAKLASDCSEDAPHYIPIEAIDTTIRSESSGIKNYLDALVTSPAATSSPPSGAGMTSYLDALPKNIASTTPNGSAMSSYAESLNRAGAISAPVLNIPTTTTLTPDMESQSFKISGNVATSSSNYLDALSSSATSATPIPAASLLPAKELQSFEVSGNVADSSSKYLEASSSSSVPGSSIRGYLDALPSAPLTATRGSGMTSYLDGLSSSIVPRTGHYMKAGYISGVGILIYTKDSISTKKYDFPVPMNLNFKWALARH